MEDNILYIVLGVVFLVVRYLMSSNKNKNKTKAVPKRTPQTKTVQQKSTSSDKKQNIDDIFNEFVRELEKTKTKTQPKVAPKVQPKKQSVDWQQVSSSKLRTKKQEIYHEDYHDHSQERSKIPDKKPLPPVENPYAQGVEFDAEEIDWQNAIIAKEILDRRYK